MSASEVDPVAEGQEGQRLDGRRRRAGTSLPTTTTTQGALGMVTAAVREVVVVVVMALVLSFVVKTWLLQAFFIPSGSMEDTLARRRPGHRLEADARPGRPQARRRRRLPGPRWLARGRAARASARGITGAIHDGLVFVGLLPAESEDHLIKRVIGLPGDHVVCCSENRKLTVNGVEITEPYLKPGDVPSSLTFDITVPAGHVWVMGDHRSDSEDSRFHDPSGTGSDGSVPIDDITGRAVAVVWPLDRAGLAVRPRGDLRRRPRSGGRAVSPTGPRRPSLRVERALQRDGHRVLAGMDEVGRGALAGPVTVGVVVIDETCRTAPAGRQGLQAAGAARPRADGAAHRALGPRPRRRSREPRRDRRGRHHRRAAPGRAAARWPRPASGPTW